MHIAKSPGEDALDSCDVLRVLRIGFELGDHFIAASVPHPPTRTEATKRQKQKTGVWQEKNQR